MSERRQDPITRDWVIISPERSARPHDHGKGAAGACPFCPGSEHLTPDATDTLSGPDGRWLVRAVPNRFPMLRSDLPATEDAGVAAALQARACWRRVPGYGHHEVIVATPEHAALGGAGAIQTGA